MSESPPSANNDLDGPSVPICVPALGGKMAVAELVDWLKAPGDAIERGEVLFEVETDKAAIAVVAVMNGRLLERALTRGRVHVGQVVGLMTVSAGEHPAKAGEAVVGRYEIPSGCQP